MLARLVPSNPLLFLCLLILAAICLLWPELGFAQSTAFPTTPSGTDTPMGDVLTTVAGWMSGNAGKGLAVIAMTVVGILATLGRIDWKYAMMVGVGVAVVFGATGITDQMKTSATGSSETTSNLNLPPVQLQLGNPQQGLILQPNNTGSLVLGGSLSGSSCPLTALCACGTMQDANGCTICTQCSISSGSLNSGNLLSSGGLSSSFTGPLLSGSTGGLSGSSGPQQIVSGPQLITPTPSPTPAPTPACSGEPWQGYCGAGFDWTSCACVGAGSCNGPEAGCSYGQTWNNTRCLCQ